MFDYIVYHLTIASTCTNDVDSFVLDLNPQL